MSRADVFGLIGVLILVAGIVYLAISALVLLFPKQSSGFATPADEQDARDAVNNRPSFSMSGPMIGAWPSGEVPGEKTQNPASAAR